MRVEELKKRKELRLKQYDYSAKGAYFVTICVKDRKRILSDIVSPVGGGALDAPLIPCIRLTRVGEIVRDKLLSSENISGVTIDRYVIMPDHIHILIFLDPDKYVTQRIGSSRAPTPTNKMLPHVISTFKRFCGKELGSNIFQRGYIEHIVRDRKDYEARAKYIYENPIRWLHDGIYVEEGAGCDPPL